MLISRYLKPVESYRRRGVDLFHDFLNSLDEGINSDVMTDFKPAVNTREGKEAYHVDVDLPGVKKEDIEINVENNVLTVSGKREAKSEVKEEDYYRIESRYGKFQRSFTLPDKVDTENIRAACEDGVLEVIIPKLQIEKSSAKKIEIK